MTTPIDEVSGKEYDFVVIGGGTAGLALASRLSEGVDTSVLVIEAGAANLNDPLILTPALYGVHFNNPEYDWAFHTVPQESLGGRSVYWARGKTLGGSSAINFFQFHRPPKADIDAFEKLGNPGWNWDLFKKYYDKSTGFVPPLEQSEFVTYDSDQHNADGPLKYSYPMMLSGFEKPFYEVLKSIGIERIHDPLLGETRGAWITPVSINPKEKVRTYATNMYYAPIQDRANLAVIVSSHVTKITLKKESNGLVSATGVVFIHDGATHTVTARKEVVLSAGAIMSPQILELSGIGKKEILEKAGVKVEVNLPGVGENVQEHIYSGTSFEVKKDVEDQFSTFDCLRDPAELPKQQMLLAEGKGAFSMVSSCMAFMPLASATPAANEMYQDLKRSINEGIAVNRYSQGLQKQYKLQLEVIEQGHPTCEIVLAQAFATVPALPKSGTKYITMASFLNHPFSRGTIHIKSGNALEPPAIDPHYFEEKYDLRLFIELVKLNRRLVKEEALSEILTGEETNPGLDANTDEAIGDYLKANFTTTFHTVGSCSMLPLEDGGVVDPKLKVYGTTNIRVVDVSILPLQIGAHMQGESLVGGSITRQLLTETSALATAYAIGEIAADIIKGKI